MPEVAANTTSAVLSDWPVPENVEFAVDEPIATVETEKAVVDVPADAAGVILRTLVVAGAEVEVGAPIAVIGDPGEVVDDIDRLVVELGGTPAVAEPEPTRSAVVEPTTRNGRSSRIFSSPLARRLARESGLSIDQLVGTGPGGRIVRRDIEAAINGGAGVHATAHVPSQPAPGAAAPSTASSPPVAPPASAPASTATWVGPTSPAADFTDVPHSRIRRAVASRLTESKLQAPHFYLRGTANVDRLLRLREQINRSGAVRISVNDLVVKAAARAHRLVPAMNVIWMTDAVRSFENVDIAVAVATERGLVTPVVRGVDRLSISVLAASTADLVNRAKSGRLRQDELEGGTLTVTNLGMYGTEEFAAIINPPQSAILSVGAARQEPVVRDGKLRVATVMHVTLSVDHRPVDGTVAAEWMRAFVALVEEPVQILA
jgi:pyruvate dehydrogenase E2 component (dihydrolipoamide acetyltransferase)